MSSQNPLTSKPRPTKLLPRRVPVAQSPTMSLPPVSPSPVVESPLLVDRETHASRRPSPSPASRRTPSANTGGIGERKVKNKLTEASLKDEEEDRLKMVVVQREEELQREKERTAELEQEFKSMRQDLPLEVEQLLNLAVNSKHLEIQNKMDVEMIESSKSLLAYLQQRRNP